jgi:G-patch domain
MATAASPVPKATAAAAVKSDKRNLEWKSNNVGSRLLSKMGWKDGQAVGKRQREKGLEIHGEGLRVVRRQEGLGIGAASQAGAFARASSATQHVQEFATLLESLQRDHPTAISKTDDDSDGNQRRRKKIKTLSSSGTTRRSPVALPTNKMTNAKVRNAKFQEKSEHDMKCIFGGAHPFPVVFEHNNTTVESDEKRKQKKESKKKRRRRQEEGSDDQKGKKRKKKSKSKKEKTKE